MRKGRRRRHLRLRRRAKGLLIANAEHKITIKTPQGEDIVLQVDEDEYILDAADVRISGATCIPLRL